MDAKELDNYPICMSELQRIIRDNKPSDCSELVDLCKMFIYDRITQRLEREEQEFRRQQSLEDQKITSGDD